MARILQGKERFKELLEINKHRDVLLYGDPDVDGVVSLRLMVDLCRMLDIEYSYYINDKRRHGFTINPHLLRGKLVLASDFTITQAEVEDIVKHDVILLSTDHHKVQKDFIHCRGIGEGLVLNNQYPFEPKENRYLSGAGVFYELICSLYPEFQSNEREVLVGLTLLSDVCNIENERAKYYLSKTYNDENYGDFIHYLIKSCNVSGFNFGRPRLDRSFVDFTLCPRLNAMLRFNKTQEAVEFILGEAPWGLDSTYRDKQAELIDSMLSTARILKMPSLHVLAFNEALFGTTDISSFIGVSCGRYSERVGSISVLGFSYRDGDITRASFRGRYNDVDYNTAINGVNIKAEGHPGAFGILDFMPKKNTWEILDGVISEVEKGHKITANIRDVQFLSQAMLNYGSKYANENCYIRDAYRNYFRYIGKGAVEKVRTYKTRPMEQADYDNGVKPDVTKKGIPSLYVLNEKGEKIVAYIEYDIDGYKVKSFGLSPSEGLIMPIVESGYVNLYIRNELK